MKLQISNKGGFVAITDAWGKRLLFSGSPKGAARWLREQGLDPVSARMILAGLKLGGVASTTIKEE